jgi:hypothetical protein
MGHVGWVSDALLFDIGGGRENRLVLYVLVVERLLSLQASVLYVVERVKPILWAFWGVPVERAQ